MKNKSVLHISASSSVGGGPIFILNLCKHSPNDSYYYGPDGPLLKIISVYCRIISTYNFLYNFYLIKKIRFNNIYNIHIHGRGALLLNIINLSILRFIFRDKKTNIIFTPHGVGTKFSYYDFISNILCFFLVDTITFVSNDEYKLYSGLYYLKNRYKIIKNGVQINSNLLQKSLIKNNNIVSFSRFSDQKNTLELCKIAHLLPEFNFIVYGEGADKVKCIQYCFDNNIDNVVFNNFTDNSEVAILSGFCYLTTSLWEGLPLSVLEAISLHRSICLTKVIGHIEFMDLEFENIAFYELGDVVSAANNIKKLHASFTTQFSEKNIIKFKKIYDIKTTIINYQSIYI